MEILEQIKELLQREDLLKSSYPTKDKYDRADDSYRLSIQFYDGKLWVIAHQEDWEGDNEYKVDTLENLLNKKDDK